MYSESILQYAHGSFTHTSTPFKLIQSLCDLFYKLRLKFNNFNKNGVSYCIWLSTWTPIHQHDENIFGMHTEDNYKNDKKVNSDMTTKAEITVLEINWYKA